MKHILIIFLIAASACSPKTEKVTEPAVPEQTIRLTDEQRKTFELTLTQVESRALNATLHLNGKVTAGPADLVSVTSALGGYVQKINLLPGAAFSRGQVLAVLEDNQFIQLQHDYLTTRVQLKTAELNYQRQRELNRSQAASDKVLQQAETDYKTLVVSQKALEEKLRMIHLDPKTISADNISRTVPLYAPFSGTVSQILVNTGQYVSPTQTLFELVNPKGLLVQLKAFEKDLSVLKTGQTVRFSFSGKETAPGRILSIGNTIHEDGTADLLVQPTGKTDGWVHGMYCTAEIETENRNTYVLPDAGVVMFENKWYAFEQVSEATFQLTEVKPGLRQEGYTEILNGEQFQGKSFVEKGAYTLLMALKNKTMEE